MGFETYFESGEQKQVKGHFAVLVKVAKADGHVGPQEERLLARLAKNFHITEEEFKEILNGEVEYAFIPPVKKEDRYTRFINLIRMMVVDGEVDYFEYRTLIRFAAGLSLPEDKVELLINNTIESLNEGNDVDDVVEQFNGWLK